MARTLPGYQDVQRTRERSRHDRSHSRENNEEFGDDFLRVLAIQLLDFSGFVFRLY